MGKKPRRQRTAGKSSAVPAYTDKGIKVLLPVRHYCCNLLRDPAEKGYQGYDHCYPEEIKPSTKYTVEKGRSPLPWPAEAILKLISYSLLSCAAGKIRSRRLQSACQPACTAAEQHHRTAKRRTRQGSASRGLYLQRYFNTAVSQLFEIHIVIGNRYYLSDKPRFLLLVADFIRGEAFEDREQLRIVY